MKNVIRRSSTKEDQSLKVYLSMTLHKSGSIFQNTESLLSTRFCNSTVPWLRKNLTICTPVLLSYWLKFKSGLYFKLLENHWLVKDTFKLGTSFCKEFFTKIFPSRCRPKCLKPVEATQLDKIQTEGGHFGASKRRFHVLSRNS